MHTKGPFSYNKATQCIECNNISKGALQIAHLTPVQTDDNGTLLAAAPDMAETLKITLHAITAMSTTQFFHGGDKQIRDRILKTLEKAGIVIL